MKQTMIYGIAFSLVGLGMAWQSGAAGVYSLRGDAQVEEESTPPSMKPYAKDQQIIPRDYLQQPPLIPHQIESYTISIKYNKCLSCHSWANYKEKGATKISQTHFQSSDGAVLANVSPRRYFCTQCHVPQVNAPPLVENTFKPVDALRIR